MEFLSSILAGIGGFIAGFVGHITAHDFCAAVPKWSRALIVSAARRVARADRARYQEEWLADLEERPTVYSKLAHAFGCFRCAWKMRRQSPSQTSTAKKIRLEFVGSGGVDVNVDTALLILDMLKVRAIISLLASYLPKFARKPLFNTLKWLSWPVLRLALIRRLRRANAFDVNSFGQSINLATHKNTTGFQLYIDGKLMVDSEKNRRPSGLTHP